MAQGCEYKKIKVKSKEELQTLIKIKGHPANVAAVPSRMYKSQPHQIKPLVLINSFLHNWNLGDKINDYEKDLEFIMR